MPYTLLLIHLVKQSAIYALRSAVGGASRREGIAQVQSPNNLPCTDPIRFDAGLS